jgi:hypothetical protein
MTLSGKRDRVSEKRKPATLNSLQRNIFPLYAAAMAIATLYFVWICWYIGPFKDMWVVMDVVRELHLNGLNLDSLFAIHGGAHRIVIPKLFFLAEYSLFSGTNVFLMLVSIMFQCLAVAVFGFMLFRENYSSEVKVFLLSLSVLLMFNATQLENFVYTFDMQWFATAAFAVLAVGLWCFVFENWSRGQGGIALPVLAVVASLCSGLSSFSGVCLWLIVPLMARAWRLSWRAVGVMAVTAVCFAAWYVSGDFGGQHQFGQEAQGFGAVEVISFSTLYLKTLLKWIALYFGSPLGREFFWPGALAAFGGVLYLVRMWWVCLIQQKPITRFEIFCLSIALFAFVVGCSTGLGRMYFVNTADEDRYQTIVLVFWLGIFAHMWAGNLEWLTSAGEKLRLWLRLWVLVWACVVLPYASFKDATAHVNFFDRVRLANLAIVTGQTHFDQIKSLVILGDKWNKTNRPEIHSGFLMRQGWGMYGSWQWRLLQGDRSLDELPRAGNCFGGVGSIKPVGPGYSGSKLAGKAVDDKGKPLTRVILVEKGKVVGFGQLRREKNSLLPTSLQPPESAGWSGYTVHQPDRRGLQLLGLARDGLCEVKPRLKQAG